MHNHLTYFLLQTGVKEKHNIPESGQKIALNIFLK